jgi:ATP-dependent DNA helicase RecG
MTRDELRQLIADVRRRQSKLDNLEVKAARGGTPRRRYEPRSAFAKAEMEPALRLYFLVDEIDGETIAAVEVEEISAIQKPCFYKQAGLPKGAYLRVGNTNRQMTEYEVFGYLSGRGQPTFDEELIPHAAIDALDGRLLDEYLGRLQPIRPGAGFLDGTREEVLTQLHVVARDDENVRPILAGLLIFGKYPQEFLPQLMITFVQYYGTTPEEKTPQGARFADSDRFLR